MLATAGLKAKVMVKLGEDDPNVINLIGGMVVGHNWNPTGDKLSFRFGVNLHPKKRGVRVGPSLQLTDLASLGKSVFTPRVCEHSQRLLQPSRTLCPVPGQVQDQSPGDHYARTPLG